MGLFAKKPVVCPMCGVDVDTKNSNGFGHFAIHLDDVDRVGGPLALACGCPDAVFDSAGDFPTAVVEHLRRRHSLKI